MDGMMYLKWGYLLSTLVYSFLGLGFFALGVFIVDKLTPFSLADQLVKEKNPAIAIVIAGLVIAQGIIIAAAIGGN